MHKLVEEGVHLNQRHVAVYNVCLIMTASFSAGGGDISRPPFIN